MKLIPLRSFLRLAGLILILGAVASCAERRVAQETAIMPTTNWDSISAQARGQTVRMAMWDGDPLINAYMRDFVAPELKQNHGVHLQIVGLHGGALINKLLVDLEAGREQGDVDVVWINGENFYQLRRLDALYGPFTASLPNNRFIDWDNPFIAYDFQEPVAGYECPWGNVQLAIIFDSNRVTHPPRTLTELETWVRAHPGRFTFDTSFTGMTFLKCLLIDLAGGPETLSGPFDEAKYQAATEKLWDYLRRLRPYLWRAGETFPENVAQLHQLLANGEVDFSMSNNDGEVDNKVMQGVLPDSARAYTLDSGTIRNSHYLGIPRNSPRKPAAMVLINFLISPEAQWRKATPQTWGDGTVLSEKLLPDEWQRKFQHLTGRIRVAPRAELEQHALMEPSSQLMIRLHEDFRREIIEHGR
jgi:putative spermidine/putrescine transport system substrate-binding protein